MSDINVGLLYLFAVSSLSVYGILLSGWASNSKYAFLGSIRSAAQMISYEVSIGFVIVNVSICSGSLNLSTIVECQKNGWYCLPLLPMFIIFCISTCLLVLIMAIHKSVNYCVKQFKHDQDNGEDIGAKFLLCCLDSEFSSLDKKHNSLKVHIF